MPLNSITARDFMTTKVFTLTPLMDMMEAMQVLARYRISGAPVLDMRGNMVGILTERDCLRTMVVVSYHGECRCGAVAEFMSKEVQTVEPGTSLLRMAELFVSTRYRRFPVLHDERLVGIVSRKDAIRAMLELA